MGLTGAPATPPPSTPKTPAEAGGGTLVCCNQPMTLQEENTTDAAREKHVPVVQGLDGAVKVTVGSVAHPMQPEHYIEWISLCADGTTYRVFLKPGDAPEAEFCIDADDVSAHSYCNLHGLWKSA